MRKKLLSVLLLAVFLTSLFVLPPPVIAATTTNWGEVYRTKNTREFYSLSFNITSPGVASVFFRTEEVYVQIGPYKATLDGQTYFNGIINRAVTFEASDLAAAAGTNIATLTNIINDPCNGINLSVRIGIYDHGKRIAEITNPSQIATVCGTNGKPGTCGYYFPASDQADMASRWGAAYDPQKPPQQYDLEAYSITVRDDSNNSVSTLTPGKQYRISATFRNSSNIQCTNAILRMYFQGNTDPDMKFIGSETQSISINGQISNTQSWVFTATEGDNGLIASINRDYQGYGCWKNNLFNSGGSSYTEPSYDNNVFAITLSAAKSGKVSTTGPSAYDLAGVRLVMNNESREVGVKMADTSKK